MVRRRAQGKNGRVEHRERPGGSPSPAHRSRARGAAGPDSRPKYAMARKGLIPAVWLGRQLRFEPRAILNWFGDRGTHLSRPVLPERTKAHQKAAASIAPKSTRGAERLSARPPINASSSAGGAHRPSRDADAGGAEAPRAVPFPSSRPRISYRSNSPGRSYGRDGTSMIASLPPEHRDAWRGPGNGGSFNLGRRLGLRPAGLGRLRNLILEMDLLLWQETRCVDSGAACGLVPGAKHGSHCSRETHHGSSCRASVSWLPVGGARSQRPTSEWRLEIFRRWWGTVTLVWWCRRPATSAHQPFSSTHKQW